LAYDARMMRIPGSSRLVAAAVAFVAFGAAWALPREAPPPNIVIIFTDDQGYADVGVYGAEAFATPNLDRMAAEGMRFTDFYVAQPVCSASRMALLTGCYPNRVGIAGALGPRATHGINEQEVTLAELCRSRGYATAIYGKWHLGHLPPFLPPRHGFDEYYGTPYSNDMWPLHPDYVNLPSDAEKRKRGYPDLPIYENDRIVDPQVTADDQKQFTRSLTERAVAFIDAHADAPFFLYVAHPMPHVPLYTSDEFAGVSGAGIYGDVISEIDWSTGRILDALARHGLDDRTLVIFTSDNGPWLSYGDHAGSAGPLREGKGTTFEGGVRVPCLMRWPGAVPAGRVCREPLMTIDIFPTVAALIGADLPEHTIDGRDASALILGRPGARSPQEAYFFYYHDNHLEAMRCGRWKLHFPHGYRSMEGREPGSGGTPGTYDYERKTGLELYDLEADIGETTDVAADHPDVVARLVALADAMRADLGDKLTGVEASGARPAGRVSGGTR
jgi:arylsulfatase A